MHVDKAKKINVYINANFSISILLCLLRFSLFCKLALHISECQTAFWLPSIKPSKTSARMLLIFFFFKPKIWFWSLTRSYCWFSHDVTKFQTLELLIFLRFYFHDVLEQLKTNIHANFHSEWVLGLVIDYAWISKLLRDVTFTWRARELLCWFKRWLVSGNSAIWTVLVLE